MNVLEGGPQVIGGVAQQPSEASSNLVEWGGYDGK